MIAGKHHRTGNTARYAGTEGKFLLPHHEKELQRCRDMHAVFFGNAPDSLIQTPLPLEGSRIEIMDVGCADGLWLHEVAKVFPYHQWHLHGVDIHRAFFQHIDKSGEKLHLQIHDANKPFADKLHGKFDIVHQRLMSWAVHTDDWLAEVGNLVALLKPAGWLQLVEMEWVNKNESAPSPILQKQDVFQDWTGGSNNMDIHVVHRLDDLMKQNGLRNVQRFVHECGIGAKAKNPSIAKLSMSLYEAYRVFEQRMPNGIPGVAQTPDELHHFLDDLEDYVRKYGYGLKLHVIIGQKS